MTSLFIAEASKDVGKLLAKDQPDYATIGIILNEIDQRDAEAQDEDHEPVL